MRRFCRSESDAIHINVLFSFALIVALFSWFGGLKFVTSLPHFCIFEYVLGFPCPGCDITAALLALAHFDINRSIFIQPCGIGLASTVFIQSTIRGAYLLRVIKIQTANEAVSALNITFTASLIIFWIIRIINI